LRTSRSEPNCPIFVATATGKAMKLRFFLLLLSLLFNVPRSEAQLRVDGAVQHVQQGDMALKIGDWEKAMFHYTNAVFIDPDYADAFMKRAMLFGKMGRTNESLEDYNRAISLNPHSAFLYDQRAKLKIIALDFPGAEADMSKAQSVAPSDPHVRESVMDNYLMMENYQSALQQADSILTFLGQYDHYIHLKRALVLVFSGDPASALTEIDKAIYEDPGSAVAKDLRGVILLKINRPEEAIKAFTSAIHQSPTFELAYYNRALAHRILANETAAEADFTRALELATDKAHVAFARAQSRKSLGDEDGAMEDLDLAIDIDPGLKEALFHRSFLKKMLGDKTGALNDADMAIIAGKKSPEVWNHRANLHLIFGDYAKAIEDYSMAIFNRNDYAIAYYNRGLAYIMNGRTNLGCNDLRKAVELGYDRAEEMLASFCSRI
jgi:tetratricopeptide (TPR) repeat protein